MKITFTPLSADRKVNPYRKRETGNLIYVYDVEGTPEEIAEYKKHNPKAITDAKTGKVLMFTTKFVGKSAELVKNTKADNSVSYFVDTKELDMRAALEKQWGPTIAAEKMAEFKAGQ